MIVTIVTSNREIFIRDFFTFSFMIIMKSNPSWNSKKKRQKCWTTEIPEFVHSQRRGKTWNTNWIWFQSFLGWPRNLLCLLTGRFLGKRVYPSQIMDEIHNSKMAVCYLCKIITLLMLQSGGGVSRRIIFWSMIQLPIYFDAVVQCKKEKDKIQARKPRSYPSIKTLPCHQVTDWQG